MAPPPPELLVLPVVVVVVVVVVAGWVITGVLTELSVEIRRTAALPVSAT
jgi:hypothetical protein